VLTKRGKVLLGIALALILLFVVGIRATHPKSGLDHALGSAQSSVAVYRVTDSFSMDDKVVVQLSGEGSALGIVRGVADGAYDIQVGSQLYRLNNKDIRGKMLVIIPFIGSILGVIGL
jgi:hypothetical protein